MLKLTTTILFLLFFVSYKLLSNDALANARITYYKAIEKEKYVDNAIKQFEHIQNRDKNLQGLAQTYIGSLIMLKGKYALWPPKKLEYVNDGIEVMDKGLALDPNNIESLFIYGTTCHYLPFFLGKKSLADEKFRKIIELIPHIAIEKHDINILKNAMQFILDNVKLDNSEKSRVSNFLKKLN